MTPAELRAALPRTYGALLARHGTPRPIQLAGAGEILAGHDVLLCAPTASGKTEAYVAPLVERHVAAGEVAPRLLIVSPTRALANDLHRRLRERLQPAGVELGRWTGEHHDGGRMSPVTILTPEALDARLSRSPKALERVAAVALDEIHVVDGTARGDQLRILVHRLRAEREGPVQVVAASATVPDPAALAARYLVEPRLVLAGARRKIRARILEDTGPEAFRTLLAEQVNTGFRKVLCFVNARADVEVLATELRGVRPFGDQVFTHHGSLARAHRLSTEAAFLSASAAICICTSTLEIGIDIGDVDLVVLYGVPPDIPALLQRVGRGGRRADENFVVGWVAGRFKMLTLRAMLQAASRGEWLTAPYGFRPGVLVQQALSSLQARPSRSIDGEAMVRRLPPDLAAAWPVDRIERVFASAAEQGWFGPPSAEGRFPLGPRGEEAWPRGSLHSNLSEVRDIQIHDAVTGDVVGSVATLDGTSVGLAGKARSVVHLDGRRVVTAQAEEVPGTANFGARAGVPLSGPLATAWLRGAGIPAPCRANVGGSEVLFHGLGSAAANILAFVLRKATFRLAYVGRLAIVLDAPWPEVWPTVDAIPSALGHRHRGIARKLSMGAFHWILPEAEQVAAVGALAELDQLRAFLRAGPPPQVPCDDEELWREAAYG